MSHCLRDVFGLSEALQQRCTGQILDSLLAFAVEEQLRGGRPRSDRVDGDVLAPPFAG